MTNISKTQQRIYSAYLANKNTNKATMSVTIARKTAKLDTVSKYGISLNAMNSIIAAAEMSDSINN
jgi:hypothetical protein